MSLVTVVTVSVPERKTQLAEAAASLGAQTMWPVPWLLRVDEPDTWGPAHVAHQRNLLLRAIDTEWYAVLDDDDVLDPSYLEKMAAATQDADIVYSWCTSTRHPQIEFDPNRLREENFIDGESWFRTEAVRAVGGYPVGDTAEDWQLLLRLLDNGARFVCVPEVLRDHRDGGWRRTTGS